MKKLKELSLFLPCYNEEENLKNTVEKAVPVLKKVTEKYELIIVNDGSKDNTGKIASDLAKKFDFIKVINHSPNRGYGAALKSGMYSSKYEWITFIDSDGQFDFSEISGFIEKQEKTGADLVIGYYLKRAVPFYRIMGSKIWELAVWTLFGMKVKDTDCGFKLFRKKVVQTIPKLEAERGPFISSEFLIKAKRAGFKMVEIGVHHYPRQAGQETGSSLKVIISGLSDLIRLRRKIK